MSLIQSLFTDIRWHLSRHRIIKLRKILDYRISLVKFSFSIN